MFGNHENRDRLDAYVALTEGAKVGRYTIVRLLGSGGMGDVYLAEDTELKRKVALKFLSFALGSDPACKTRFTREAQATAKLNHPNIVTVYEVGEFKGRPFMAMEYIEGQSLKELIHQGALPLAQALDIAIQICDGLQEAHVAGIVHRDIKPANILIDKKGRPRILDFGLAMMQGAESLTQTSSTLGTVNYMSPEQVLAKDVDSRSDIFSIGIVLYEMLSGRLPFSGDQQAAMMYAIANTAPLPLQESLPDAPPDLFRVVNRLLEKAPADRYQSTADVAIELSRLKKDTSRQYPEPQTRILPGQRGRKSSRPFFRRLSVRIAAIAIIVAFTAVLYYLLFPSKVSRPGEKSVAVLPFQNLTGDPSLNPLGQMIADWTTQGLMQTGLADVIPPESIPERDSSESIGSMAKKIGAGTIVTGSYYKLGDSIQVHAKVIDANEKVLQAIEPVTLSAGKIMDAVQAVREKVMGAFAYEFGERSQDFKMIENKPPNFEAYQSYIYGVDVYKKSRGVEGIEYFNRAYLLDTTFIYPLMLVFFANYNLGQTARADSLLKFMNARRDRLNHLQQLLVDEYTYDIAGDHYDALKVARELAIFSPRAPSFYSWARQALATNRPREAIDASRKIDFASDYVRTWSNYWNLLAISYHASGDYKKELEISEQGRKLYPTDMSILLGEIRAFAALGKTDEIRKRSADYSAILEQERSNLGEFMRIAAEELRAHGYEDSALAFLDQAIQWYESLPADQMKVQRLNYGIILYEARRWQEAKNIFEELDKEHTDSMDYSYPRIWLGSTFARIGDRERALEVSEWSKGITRPFLYGGPTYNRASIAAILGDKEEAVALLREALSQGYYFFYVHTDMDFESLRNYPPYVELMKPKG